MSNDDLKVFEDFNSLEDFPAAHSMDTAWFGVDDNGEIAVFETGEGGAAPVQSGSCGENLNWQDMFDGCPVDEKGLRCITVDGTVLAAFCKAEPLQDNLKAWRELSFSENLIVVYASEEDVPFFPKVEFGIALRFSGPEFVIFYPEFLPLEEEDLHELDEQIEAGVVSGGIIGIGPVLGKVSLFDETAAAQGLSREQLLETVDEFSLPFVKETIDKGDEDWFMKYLGVHVYQPDEEAGHYEAARRPLNALKFDDLPTSQKKRVDFVPLKGMTLADTAAVQPIAFAECVQYAVDWWVGIDGSVHLDQRYKRGKLLDKEGQPFSDETLDIMGVRDLGEMPIAFDYNEHPEIEASMLEKRERRERGWPVWKWLGVGGLFLILCWVVGRFLLG